MQAQQVVTLFVQETKCHTVSHQVLSQDKPVSLVADAEGCIHDVGGDLRMHLQASVICWMILQELLRPCGCFDHE